MAFSGCKIVFFVLVVKVALVQNAPQERVVDASDLSRIAPLTRVVPTVNANVQHVSGPLRASDNRFDTDNYDEKKFSEVDSSSMIVMRYKDSTPSEEEVRSKIATAFNEVFSEKSEGISSPASVTFVTGVNEKEEPHTTRASIEDHTAKPAPKLDASGDKTIYAIANLNDFPLDTSFVMQKKNRVYTHLKKTDIILTALRAFDGDDGKDDTFKEENDDDDKPKKKGHGLAIGLSILGVLIVVGIIGGVYMARKRNQAGKR